MTLGSTPRKKRKGSALALLTLVFLLSGAVRLLESSLPSVAWATTGASEAAESVALTPTTDNAGCELAPLALVAALSAREARVQAREVAIADRAAALQLAEDVLHGKLEAIEAAEAQLRDTIAIADAGAETDVARLTVVYEAMKPKDAAALFDAMDPGFAAGFLGRMRPDAAAAVLAGMAPDKAYAVSAILAGRNATAPKG